jgi:hypothetical protein
MHIFPPRILPFTGLIKTVKFLSLATTRHDLARVSALPPRLFRIDHDAVGDRVGAVLLTASSGREQSLTETTAALLDYLIGAALIAGLGREVVDGVAVGRGAVLAGARGGVAALATVWRGAAAVGVRDTTRFGAGAT